MIFIVLTSKAWWFSMSTADKRCSGRTWRRWAVGCLGWAPDNLPRFCDTSAKRKSLILLTSNPWAKWQLHRRSGLMAALRNEHLKTRRNTSCYIQYWPEKLIPWAILCFQPLWVIGGPYYSSCNFFYLAVFEIADLVGIFSSKTEAFSPKGQLFYS